LDEQEDDGLAEGGELNGGVADDQAGDADSTGGGETGVEPCDGVVDGCGFGKFQENRTDDDHRDETGDEEEAGLDDALGECDVETSQDNQEKQSDEPCCGEVVEWEDDCCGGECGEFVELGAEPGGPVGTFDECVDVEEPKQTEADETSDGEAERWDG